MPNFWPAQRLLVSAGTVLPLIVAAAAPAQPLSRLLVATLNPGTAANTVTGIAQPPGNTRDLFIAEQNGQVWDIHDGAVLPAPILNLGTSVIFDNESGLLGIAFHPQFESNGFFYLCYHGYLPGSGSQVPGVHVVRYSTDPSDPASVSTQSALHIFHYLRTGSSSLGHFGGWMGFGPDGHLYISSGDGAVIGVPIPPSQNLASSMGKVLRIDVDHDDFPADPLANYAIPPSNPFAGSTTARPEIWAYGLRNPWRCSFDRLTGDLWIADVGSATREEINFLPAPGAPPYEAPNYGWPCMEGTLCNSSVGCTCHDPGLALPIHEYPTLSSGAVIGGYVYRGSAIPQLQGTYVFADFAGPIWSFRYNSGGITDFANRSPELGSFFGRTTFGEGSDGELYIGARVSSPLPIRLEISRIVRPCPANCDASSIEPRLNVNDFICFLNRFAAGDSYANCDGSTTPPVLNIADFLCYMNAFDAGCP